MREPLLFAAHYAVVGVGIDFKGEIKEVLSRIKKKYAKHERVLQLLSSLRGQIPTELSADLAKRLAEGLDLHAEFSTNIDSYLSACTDLYVGVSVLDDLSKIEGDKSPEGRVRILSDVLEFSVPERKTLSFALAFTVSAAFQLFVKLCLKERGIRSRFWQSMLDLTEDEVREAMSPRGKLLGSGLLFSEDGSPRLSDFWSKVIVETETPIADSIVVPMSAGTSPGGASRLPHEDQEIIKALLATVSPGANILLYGNGATDKKSLAHRLITDADCLPFTLAYDIPNKDSIAATIAAQHFLKSKTSPVLVVPAAQNVFSRASTNFSFLGISIETDDDVKPLDERILAGNPVPTIWITNDPQRLHTDTLARFLFHSEALRAARADRRVMLESVIAQMPLAEQTKSDLIRLEGLSEQQVLSAKDLAERIAGDKPIDKALLTAAIRSQKAMARREKDEARQPITQYSLDLINSAGRFGPTQILKALRIRPNGSICFYGLPGTGKTQFAEHIAHELGIPILIKRASDIFDKYVGESEKRIAEAFDQAEQEGALLLLDEADSFLQDRSRSRHQWEISTVNELLQRMERHDGVFVCTTNLFQSIDVAALRRFTFKLEFLPLNVHQRWTMFVNESRLDQTSLSQQLIGQYEERLTFMRNLTPGDFATIQRQCKLMGETLTPEQWLEQLEIEVSAKNKAAQQEESLHVSS